MKKIFFAFALAAVFVTTTAQAAKTKNWKNWFDRTDISFKTMKYSKPTWSLETVQPIYQSPKSKHTTFFQGKLARTNPNNTVNLGVGYRYLIPDQTWILGANGFYDVTSKHHHQRLSAGAEAIGKYVTARANYYYATTGHKTVAAHTTQKTLGGYDAELEIPVPYLPWMRLVGNFFHWDTNTAKVNDTSGNIIYIRSNITDRLTIDLGCKHDNNIGDQNFVMFTFNIMGNSFNGITQNMWDGGVVSKKPFVARDLTKRTLDKIVRQNDMQVEYTTEV